MFTTIKIEATNDVNGNPRRGWLVYEGRDFIGFVDEEHAGNGAVLHALRLNDLSQVNTLATVRVTPSEYRDRVNGPRVVVAETAGVVTRSEVTSARAGTWLDGARGWTINAEVIATAWRYGMPHSDWDEKILDHYLHGRWDKPLTLGAYGARETLDVPDVVINQGGMFDHAEEWLNDHYAPEGFTFGSDPDGGGWGLWPNDDDEPGEEIVPNAGSVD